MFISAPRGTSLFFVIMFLQLDSSHAFALAPSALPLSVKPLTVSRSCAPLRSVGVSALQCSEARLARYRQARTSKTALSAGAAAAAAAAAMPPVTLKGIILLATTIGLELAGATCMKLSNNFANPIPSVLLFVFYALSFGLFTVTLQYWPISVAYAIWSGVGTAAMALIGVAVFSEVLKLNHIVGIVLIIAGVIAMNL